MEELAAEGSDELTKACLRRATGLAGGPLSGINEGVRGVAVWSCAFPVFCGTALRRTWDYSARARCGYRVSALAAGYPGRFRLQEPGHDEEGATRSGARCPRRRNPSQRWPSRCPAHPFYGKLTFIRVYSGKLEAGSQVLNSTKGKKERIGKIFQMHSNKENPVEEAHAGHIYAVIGLKDTTTGDTLCAIDKPVVLESMTFPKPVIHVAVEPKSKADQEKMGVAIQKLAEEPRPSRSSSIPKPARPLLAVSASFTSTSSLTVCVANSRSRQTLVSPWLPAKPFVRTSKSSSTRTRSRPVVPVSSQRS